MKIRHILKEAAGVTAAFAFGRFNPAHQGHMEVWKKVQESGVKWYIGTNPSTLGPNDPLTFEQKSAWMAEIYPPIAGHIAAEQSVVTLAAKIFKDLGNKEDATIAYITDDTDWAWSGKLLNQYNGVEGKHGYYKFAQIVHIPSPRVSSATDLRNAARANDKVAFYHASGTDPKLKVAGKTYFDTVKEACERFPLPANKAPKTKAVAEGLELIEAINPDIRNPEFEHEQEIGDYLYTAKTHKSESGMFTYLLIRCYDGDKLIGKVNFEIRLLAGKKWLESQQTEVLPEYKKQGIASTMYAYAKMLGNTVKPSPYQSDEGKGMWAGWKKSGSAKHLTTEQEVEEISENLQLVEYLRKIHKRWAIVSKSEGKPLVYFKGEGKPSKEWVKKQERRINYFKHKK